MSDHPYRRRATITIVMALTLALILSGCSRYSRHGAKATSTAPVSYGDKNTPPSTPASSTTAKRNNATIVTTVTDDKGRALAGAIVRLKGAKAARATSDGRGRVRFVVAPGRYVVDVAPCGSTVITDSYDAFDAKVGPGQSLDASLSGISWHLRYRPEGSVAVLPKPPWARNSNATLRVHIADGCDVSHVAAGVSIGYYRWNASSNFAIVATSSRADSSGYAPITVRCRSAGDGSIIIRNSLDASDFIDLLSAAAAPPAGKHWCA